MVSNNDHKLAGSSGRSQMMSEDSYWKIIDDSLEQGTSEDGQLEFITAHLRTLDLAGLRGFALRTYNLEYRLNTAEMFCAGYLMNGGFMSDDGFMDFRRWVISRGWNAFYDALAGPDTLGAYVEEGRTNYACEELAYLANDVSKERTGEFLFPFLSPEPFLLAEVDYKRKVEFNWSADDPASMHSICPSLYSLKLF